MYNKLAILLSIFIIPSYLLGQSNQKNLIFIAMDSVTAQHMHHNAATESYTPTFDKLRKRALTIKNFTSVSSWTKPSVASILTGMMPSQHQVQTPRDKLAANFDTLPEILQRNGYQTMGVVSHTFLDLSVGYGQGFDSYQQVNDKGNTHAAITSPIIADKALAWLEQNQSQKPFFMFLHFFDPHFNFLNHPDFELADRYLSKTQIKPRMSINAIMRRAKTLTADDLDYLRMLHAEEIALVDQQVGRLVTYLEKTGELENTIIILTADHGEEFMERNNIGHTSTLYQELVNIPFLLFDSRLSKQIENHSAWSHVDLLPTGLEILGINHDLKNLPGKSFAANMHGQVVSSQPVFSEVAYRDHKNNLLYNKIAVRDGDWKLIIDRTSNKHELYNLKVDHNEKENLEQTQLDRLTEMKKLIDQFNSRSSEVTQQPNQNNSIKYDSKEIKQLKTLGYL